MKKQEIKTKYLSGTVISTNSEKTAKVRVERVIMNTKLKKAYKIHKNYNVHNTQNGIQVGDIVKIYLGKRISKNKSWHIL